MNPSTINSNSEMSLQSAKFQIDHSNSNSRSSNRNSFLTSNQIDSTNHFNYPDLTSNSLNYINLIRSMNYQRFSPTTLKTDHSSDNSHRDYYHPHHSSFHQYSPRLFEKSSFSSSTQQTDDEILLKKFHHDTIVSLDTGESKNIQQLTTNDFLTSAKQNNQYSSVLARIQYIGPVDKTTGKAELRFYIDEIEKQTSYFVSQEMPFFVQQYSCWSSISPDQTHRKCGLKCRQLECGDIIIAITDRRKSSVTKLNDKPNYSHQSPTKSLVGRYLNGQMSTSNKRHKLSNE